jgi:hypothetical protein
MSTSADPVDLVHDAARLVVSGDRAAARATLKRIDTASLDEERDAAHRQVQERLTTGQWVAPETSSPRRPTPSQAEVLAVLRRDHYTCRYLHCWRRTIDGAVLRLLSTVLPDVLPYDPKWKLGSIHPIYCTHTASVAWSIDGINEVDENLITACSCCQFAKNCYDLALLGWEIAPISDAKSWDGLVDMEGELREVIQRRSVSP